MRGATSSCAAARIEPRGCMRRRWLGGPGGGQGVSGPDADYGHGGGAEVHGEEAGRAERQGVAVEGRVVVDAGADELGVGVVHENAGGEGVEDALGDDGALRVVAVRVAEADSQGDAQRGGERVEGAEEDLGPAAQVCVGEEGPERHALESLPRLGCQVARRAPGHGPGDRPPERARCDCEAAPGGSRWR